MSRPPKTKPIKPSVTPNPATDPPFDPVAFMATAVLVRYCTKRCWLMSLLGHKPKWRSALSPSLESDNRR